MGHAALGAWCRALGVTLAWSAGATACPCGAQPGPVMAVTGAADRVGARVGLAWQHELGSYDASGRAWANPAGVSTERGLLDVALAWRALPSWELAAMTTASVTALELPGVSSRAFAWGDTSLRARWDAHAAMPGDAAPSWAVWGSVRMPTATDTVGSSALSSATGLGLGSWEFSLGTELRWLVGARWQLAAGVEAGVRAGEGPTGATPGPRVNVMGTVAYGIGDDTTLSLGAVAQWEAPLRAGGQWVDGSATRVLTVSLSATHWFDDAWTGLAAVSLTPPIDGLGAGVPATLRVAVGAAFAR